MTRQSNRWLARLITRFPKLGEQWAERFGAATPETVGAAIPWTPLRRPLRDCRVALVSTAGVHLRTQAPFDMNDADGDPSYREIPATADEAALTITHDYYDHRDADRDINVVWPIDRLRELAAGAEIGALAAPHFSFMGHIDKHHIATLTQRTAPAVAARLRDDGVDAVLLAPA